MGSKVGSSASGGFLVAKFLGENGKFNDALEVIQRFFCQKFLEKVYAAAMTYIYIYTHIHMIMER